MTISAKNKDQFFKEASKAFTLPKNTHEMSELLRGILTPDEVEQIALRWQVVKSLLEGEPQRDIAEKLGISITTITRGSREIKHGTGIFQKIYQRFTGKKL